MYRSDVAQVSAAAGETVRVAGPRGKPIGFALYSDRSEIALRVFSRSAEPPTVATWRERLTAAIGYRSALGIDATAYRLVHGEADRLPWLVVDKYADYLVVQALTQGMDRMLPDITAMLVEMVQAGRHPRAQRSAGAAARRTRAASGRAARRRASRRSRFAKAHVTYDVDPYRGQKTGLFLDQRENRVAAALYAHGRLLDAFSYNGGFALVARATVRSGAGGRHIRGSGGADSRRTRRETASRTSKRAR